MDIQLVAEQFYEYQRFIRGHSQATISRYKRVVGIYSRFAKIQCMDEVTDKNVRELFYYGRTQRRWKASSFICYYRTLIAFFRWCVREGYLKNNPIADLELPRLEKRLPSKLTKQDALRLLEVVYNYPFDCDFLRYRNHAMLAVLLFAGLRRKELLNLKCTEVDIENLILFVNQGKGSKDRIIPMSSTLAQSLMRYSQERKKLNKTCPEFFASLRCNNKLSDTTLRRLVQQIVQSSGIRFNIHKLRHTFATLMLEGGCDIYSLSRMMGHSDISTTTIYLSASAEHLRSQVTKHPLNNLRNNSN